VLLGETKYGVETSVLSCLLLISLKFLLFEIEKT